MSHSMILKSVLYGAILSFMVPISISSQEKLSVDEISKLTFEELMNVRVFVASKTEEELLKASGTVYVLNEEDFINYGWRTVGEALQALPGMELSMSYRYLDGGHRGFGSDFSETILLIDGREIQKLRNGRASQPLMIYPLNHVKRIEVLQGPASTLYGSHALQGVISVITKTADAQRTDQKLSGSFVYGDATTQQLSVNTYRKEGDFYVGVSAHKFYSDRDWDELGEFYSNPSNIRQDDQGSSDLILNTDPDDYNNREQDYSIQLHSEYKNFFGGVQYLENDNLHTPGSGGFSGAFRAGISERLIYFGYKDTINSSIDYSAEVERLFQRDEYKNFHLRDTLANLGITDPTDFDDIDRLDIYQLDDSQRWDTKVWKFKSKVDAKIGQDNLLTTGIEFWNGNYFYALGVNTLYALESDEVDWPNTSNNKYSIFVQDRIRLLNGDLSLLAGVRYNKEDYVDDSFTPRVSVVAEPANGTVFKATYSEGFRALSFGQFGQAVGETKPTEMKMYEFNYSQTYNFNKWQLMNSLTWYSMEQVGVLERIETPSQIGIIWRNTGEKRKINGLENFLRFKNSDYSGFLSLYWIDPDQKSVAESGEEYLSDIPKYKIKLGLTTEITRHLSMSAFVDHWGETKWEMDNYDPVTRTILTGKTLYTQDVATTINVRARLTDMVLRDAGDFRFDITFAVDNITNELYSHHLRPWIAMGYLQPPRTFHASLTLRL